VPELGVANEEGNEELMVPDHSSQPLVVVPAAQSGYGDDRSTVEEQTNNGSAGSRKRLVMGRDLLRTHQLVEDLVEVLLRHVDRSVCGVVGVYVAHLHVGQTVLVVVLRPVLRLVDWLLTREVTMLALTPWEAL
jgi:hypothetical protein